MTDELQAYRALTGQDFELEGTPQGLSALTLVEARSLSETQENGQRRPFSLLFRGPMASRLPQATYALRRGEQEAELLFLVPVGPDEQGLCYEAVFN